MRKTIPFLLALSGCITTLEWKPVGLYGPRPTTRQIFEECAALLRDKNFQLETHDPKNFLLITGWQEFRGTEGFREQVRIKLVPRGEMTEVHVMAVKNENLGRFNPVNPAAASYGPNENHRMRESYFQLLIDQRLKGLR